MSEGIYRKAGTGSSISELLSKFRKDAFAVQLTRNAYSEYEVGTALKRFFRELPEPLFGCDHRQYLYEVASKYFSFTIIGFSLKIFTYQLAFNWIIESVSVSLFRPKFLILLCWFLFYGVSQRF